MTSTARACLLICCLLGAASGRAGATPLTAADILAREKAADKAALPGSEVEDWAVSRMGLSGTEHVARRGDDESTSLVEGPFTTRSGKLAGKAWHQNENGYTILDIAEPSQAAHAVSQTLRQLPAPANRYVVTQVMSTGLVERTTYDATDFVPVHREFERSHHIFRLDYSDFRVGPRGRRKAWLERGADDRGNTYEARLTSDQVNVTLDDAALAIPADRRVSRRARRGSPAGDGR